MKLRIILMSWSFAVLTLFSQLQLLAAPINLKSPDGNLTVGFDIHDGRPVWFLQVRGETYIKPSQLGIEIDHASMGSMISMAAKRASHQERVETVWGKFSHYDNHYNELVWTLQEKEGWKRKLAIIARAYNQGLALRYRFSESGGWKEPIRLTDDRTEFCFAADYTGWAYNGEHDPKGPQPLSQFWEKNKGARVPLTIKCSTDMYLAILEAAIFDHAPFALKKVDKVSVSFRASVSESILPVGGHSSWRVVLVGEKAGDLLTSPVMFCLNPPCAVADTHWIKSGLAFWDWRAWGAKTEDGFTYGLDMASWKRFVNFASGHNIRYLVLDANWYGPEFDKNSDPRTSRDHLVIQPDANSPKLIRVPAPADWEDPIDVPALIRYAQERNVGIILYFNDIARLNYPFEETLALYRKWGAAGIKYGFMKRKGQQKVLDTRKIVELCAKYHLLCDFHDGPVPPSGDRRTYPNYVAREFCHSQSDAMRVFSPTGFCEQVFVNMLAGPLDMCNGMYTLENPARDRPKIFRNINTTIVAETARVMITFSGLSILPDCPEAYQKRGDLFDFLTKLPMTWDETRILHGEIGEYIVTARRKDTKWFIASATNENERKLDILLDFLDVGKVYSAMMYEDAPQSHYITNREAYTIRKIQVKHGQTLPIRMAPGGGHCIYLESQ